ncbi:MAG: hypothetical protein J0I16_26650 [Rhizobiales bacterium]|nr:hypothetical protein [Hyphomicrobiales bacterium]
MKTQIKPMRQGACDRLCGAYAVLNAVSALSPDMTVSDKNILFQAMLHGIASKRQLSIDHLWAGLNGDDIDFLLDLAGGFLKRRYEYLTHHRLRRRRSASVSEVFSRLRESMDKSSVAILRVELLDSKHWTVAYKVGKHRIRLLDSAGLGDLTRDRCSLKRDNFKTRLLPSYFRIVQMVDDEPEPSSSASPPLADKSAS